MDVPDTAGSVDAREIAHGLLLALLRQHHGGTVELELAAMQAAMGDAEGRLYSLAIEPGSTPGTVRLTYVPVTDADRH